MSYLSIEHEKAVELLRQGSFDLALLQIDAALQNHKAHPILLAERGTIYMYLKRKEEALEDMDLAAYLEPENPYRYSSRAYIKDFFGDTESAIIDYEKCIELDPEDVIAMNNLGLLIEKQGNRKKAERYYQRTDDLLRQNPDWQNRVYNPDANPSTAPGANTSENQIAHSEDSASEEKKNQSVMQVYFSVFTKKSMFLEFVGYLRNGFRVK